MGQYLGSWEDRELRSQVDREDLGGRHNLAQCPLTTHPSTVCYLQAVPPGGAGAARPLAGYPTGFSEPLFQPGSAAGEYLEEKGTRIMGRDYTVVFGLLKRRGVPLHTA